MIGNPPVTMFAPPRRMLIIASVAMNGGSFATVTRNPLTMPHSAPVAMPRKTDGTSGTPALCESQPSIIIEKASTEPTERSMPPMRITSVIPMATIPPTVTWSRMFSQLRTWRKYREAKENRAQRRISPMSGP